MKILIAEDDLVSRKVLQTTLQKFGYEVVVTRDGREACQALQQADPPQLALIDWMMPEMDGLEVCRTVRSMPSVKGIYLILLTARTAKEDTVAGLESGADDYVTKPFDNAELRARIQVGRRILDLQASLANRVLELEQSIAQVKQLQVLLPICSYCKKVRADEDYWQTVECYIAEHTEARFSHGICPSCWDRVVVPELTAACPGQAIPARP